MNSPYDVRKKLLVTKFEYSPVSGALCQYDLNGKQLHFIETPERMAELLKEHGFIDFIFDNNDVSYDAGEDIEEISSLEDFMKQFCQSEWILLISNIEYGKLFSNQVFHAYDASLKKYAR